MSSNTGLFVSDGKPFTPPAGAVVSVILPGVVVGESKKGNPMVATTHGFVPIGGIRLSINAIK